MPEITTSTRSAFSDHLHYGNKDGSGKASSYIRAIDLLSNMLELEPFDFSDCINIWQVNSSARLTQLRDFVLGEQRRSDSPWYNDRFPISYLRDGYCSAALTHLIDFLPFHNHAEKVMEEVNSHQGTADELISKINIDPTVIISSNHGQDQMRESKIRIGQYAFRKMILTFYANECCITGLNIPELNRASHIIPWSVNRGTRMDPRNGLCLSATYDAAFDNHLISFDDDYRLIISQDIRDHFKSSSVKEYFLKRQGQKMTMPSNYIPQQEYLAKHREAGSF
ncbi:MAG: HNH endonuclease [Verrucomicrobiota bacterium]